MSSMTCETQAQAQASPGNERRAVAGTPMDKFTRKPRGDAAIKCICDNNGAVGFRSNGPPKLKDNKKDNSADEYRQEGQC